MTSRTVLGCHRPPRAERTPRALRALAIPWRVPTPARWISAMIGRILPACSSAWNCRRATPALATSVMLGFAAVSLRQQSLTGPLRDQPPFLFGQGGPEVKGEGVNVRSEFGDDERHPVGHETGDEVHAPAEAVELGDDHRAPLPLCSGNGGVQTGPVIVGTRLDVAVEVGDDVAVPRGETDDGVLLGVEPKTRSPLSVGRDPQVADAVHPDPPPPFRNQDERLGLVN